jgi:hypothetical protein
MADQKAVRPASQTLRENVVLGGSFVFFPDAQEAFFDAVRHRNRSAGRVNVSKSALGTTEQRSLEDAVHPREVVVRSRDESYSK